ncbi:type II toxin-antitoxin system PemK/MazF family toxin [Thermosediminibacter oceani]|uniref:Transcriptional modulator of MazE/toxin, MazF n=1 Tax=Thermosediminibacter oceani (strain ATCC BAA-1034 / DSM 16646 / JW/IW-1228P) TaxID=555079 RepID=D9S1L8_THEOJ|nr:type II toxin-antitoxin system PemK/MazF family toxin [Thermosediminibacter oceani]ADL07295.1 transcriptional modulator of MazE/toxin, MazF [Thermosediminibacter oceani DSM 16646]
MQAPDRGDLVYVNFNPQSGHEQAGRRPGIVLSPKPFNQLTGFAVFCPITRQKKGYPFEVELPVGLAVQGVILADQVKSLDWRARQLQIVGRASNEIVSECLDLIHTFLS